MRWSSFYVFNNHFSLTLIGYGRGIFVFAMMLASLPKAGAEVEALRMAAGSLCSG
jgi:hypothetical protein